MDLVGAESFDEVVNRVVAFQEEKQVDFIEGRGWNQNLWDVKEFPNKAKLDELFPNTPVALTRIDGHAYLVNQKPLTWLESLHKPKQKGAMWKSKMEG